MTTNALSVPSSQPPYKRRRSGLGFLVLLLCLAVFALAGLCAWRWLIILPPHRIQALSATQQQLNLLDQRLRVLEDQPVPAASSNSTTDTTDMARMQKEVGSLSAAIATLQGELKQTRDRATEVNDATRGVIATAVAFVRLGSAVQAGLAFPVEFSGLREAAARRADMQPALLTLNSYAAGGVPSLWLLQRQWQALAAPVSAAIAKSRAQNWHERLLAALKGLISIHAVNDPAQQEFEAVDTALARGDLAAVIAAIAQLPPQAQDQLASWKKAVESRRAVDQALAELAVRLNAEAPAPAGGAVP